VCLSPVLMCCSVFDMYTTLFKVALFPFSYNLMLANIMTVALLLLLLVVVVFYFIPPPPNVSGNSWNLILAAFVFYALKTDDIYVI